MGRRQWAIGDRVVKSARCAVLLTIFLGTCIILESPAFAAWSGVDEQVIEKIAGEHGREPRESLINTDQGDLLLFLFLAAGSIAGFAAGYYWRILIENREKQEGREPHEYQ